MAGDGPGLYVHLPWCVQKCPYCDFNSHALRDALPEAEYVGALLSDLNDEHARAEAPAPFATVFFGGGTPSLFSAESVGAVLECAAATFGLAPEAEVTLEANPGAVEHGRFDALRAAGVTRLSLGAQSFDPAMLAALGRIHGPHETRAAMDEARAAGFDNVNLDLMYALPGQDRAGALADLDAALALSPAHVSRYQLTIEPNTLFHHRPPPLPDEDTIAHMQADGDARLCDAGFDQYEVSAWAGAGGPARHNLNYWRFGDYVGIGAGAHGKLTADGEVWRTTKTRHPAAYLRAFGGGESAREARRVDAADLVFEYALNRLRLKGTALDAADFAARCAQPADALAAPARDAVARGLLAPDGPQRWRTTDLGWRFLNDLQALFLPRRAA